MIRPGPSHLPGRGPSGPRPRPSPVGRSGAGRCDLRGWCGRPVRNYGSRRPPTATRNPPSTPSACHTRATLRRARLNWWRSGTARPVLARRRTGRPWCACPRMRCLVTGSRRCGGQGKYREQRRPLRRLPRRAPAAWPVCAVAVSCRPAGGPAAVRQAPSQAEPELATARWENSGDQRPAGPAEMRRQRRRRPSFRPGNACPLSWCPGTEAPAGLAPGPLRSPGAAGPGRLRRRGMTASRRLTRWQPEQSGKRPGSGPWPGRRAAGRGSYPAGRRVPQAAGRRAGGVGFQNGA